jgi:hypothetical protein
LIANTFKSLTSQHKKEVVADNNPKMDEPKKEEKTELKSMVNVTSIGTHSKY